MKIVPVSLTDKEKFNRVVTHPLQAYEWGEFREKTGVSVKRKAVEKAEKYVDAFQMTIHKIPHTPWNVGYIPKGNLPTETVLKELQKVGKENNCIFIQLEPNVVKDTKILSDKDIKKEEKESPNILISRYPNIQTSARPLFTKYTFILDITPPEEELLKNMHSKTRYNIRVAQKHDVKVVEDNSNEAFQQYLQLTQQTTARQGFYAHSQSYHRKMWETLKVQNSKFSPRGEAGKIQSNYDELTAHLLTAKYNNQTLVTWIVFVFQDTLYYPYGASSSEHREVMASNLMMWEAIRFGKKLGLKKFDMWGALGNNPDPKDPWYGFHRFKEGYGATHTEYIGSFDFVINSGLYRGFTLMNSLRWAYLRLRKR